MLSYLILGRGIGKAIAYHLAKQEDTKLVAIIDKDKSVLELGRLLPANGTCDYLVSDVNKLNLAELFEQFDVIISALPAKFNFELAKKAIEAGTNFCDLGGVVDITWRQVRELDPLAKERMVTVIPDCGLMPGMGILIAKKLIYESSQANSISIHVGGIPQKPRSPIYYQRVFNYDGLISICYDQSPILVSGTIQHRSPFSDYELISAPELKRFHNNGRIEAFTTAGASIAPWTFKKMGIENFFEKTVRWPGFVNFVKNIPREEFVERISPHINTPVTEEDPDLVWMKVEALDYKECSFQKRTYSLLDLYDPKTGLTAMERTTGFTTAIIARMIANGQSKTGIHTPETAFNKKQFSLFWEELNKYFQIRKS